MINLIYLFVLQLFNRDLMLNIFQMQRVLFFPLYWQLAKLICKQTCCIINTEIESTSFLSFLFPYVLFACNSHIQFDIVRIIFFSKNNKQAFTFYFVLIYLFYWTLKFTTNKCNFCVTLIWFEISLKKSLLSVGKDIFSQKFWLSIWK